MHVLTIFKVGWKTRVKKINLDYGVQCKILRMESTACLAVRRDVHKG